MMTGILRIVPLYVLFVFAARAGGQPDLASSQYVTIQVCQDGVLCHGINDGAGLGDSTSPFWQGSNFIRFDDPIVFVSNSDVGTIAVDSSGAVYAWGYGPGLVFGDSSHKGPVWSPIRIRFLEPSIAAYVGGGFTVSLRRDGRVLVCGSNMQGSYGNGSFRSEHQTAVFAEIDSVTKLADVGSNVFAIRYDGSLWMWGQGAGIFDQILEHDSDYCLIPARVLEGRRFLDVAGSILKGSGPLFAAITTEGTLLQVGFNKFDIIDSDSEYVRVPVEVVFPSRCVQVLCSYENVIVRCEDGSVWMSGGKSKGQKPFSTDRLGVFTKVPIPGPVSSIYGRGYTYFARNVDGALYGWGDNTYSQLDVGLPPRSAYAPQLISTACALVSVGESSVAMKDESQVGDQVSYYAVDIQGRVVLHVQANDTNHMQPSQFDLPKGVYVLVTVTARGVRATKMLQY